MNRRMIIPLLIGTPMLAQSAIPVEEAIPDAEERRLHKLCSQSPKQYYPQLRDYLRRKLDVAYEIALATAEDDDHRRAIELAQKQWLKFYEAQRGVASYNALGGSYAAPAAMEEGIYHLRHRIHQLVTPFLQGWGRAPLTPALRKP
jgi:uncharacterized protein YecT (DUF1311 family)